MNEPDEIFDKRQGERRVQGSTPDLMRRVADRRHALDHYSDMARLAMFDEVVVELRGMVSACDNDSGMGSVYELMRAVPSARAILARIDAMRQPSNVPQVFQQIFEAHGLTTKGK